ncbi:MAG: cytochrome P450 [Dehalococcoidia bacterium]|nr:MAG: cytochrome P450 [Dehalococcoidia bacterium]
MTTGVVFNPFVPSFRANPYLQLGRLREGDPVHRSQALQAWVLTRYDDCLRVMKDAETFSSDVMQAGGALAAALREQRRETPLGETRTVLGSDPPVHTRLRSIVNRAFTPRRAAALRPHIEDVTASLLAQAPDSGEWDLMKGLAQPLPVIVIAELLGVPSEDREQFRHWSNALAATTNLLQDAATRQGAVAAAQELRGYLEAVVVERVAAPRDDLISALLEAEADGARLSRDEVLAFAVLLLVAGNETTTNLIGNGTLLLAEHPEAMQALRDDPEGVPNAVEEMLRYDSPVQGLVRFVARDTEIAGQAIKKGDVLICMIGGANRDPRQFTEPERFDIARVENRHLSFGQGIHFCLGAPLARLEADVAFRGLLARWPGIRLAEGGAERGGTFLLRGPSRVTLAVGR